MALDQVFRLAASAVEIVIEPLWGTVCDIGDDVANVEAFPRRLDPRHDAARMRPGFRGIAGCDIVAHHIEVAERAPDAYRIGLGEDLSCQHRVGRQAEDVANAVPLTPVHGLSPAIVAVAANG